MRFEKIKVGHEAEITRKISARDVQAFADLTGDDNPLHMDDSFSAKTPFKKRVVHGMLSASYISTLIGTKLPGPGGLWVSQTLNFLMPVRIGDTIRVLAKVKQKSEAMKLLVLEISVTNQKKQEVLNGEGVVKILETKEEEKMGKKTRGAALITGASRGIGAAVARKLAADGFKVVVNYRGSREEAESVVADIKEAGGDAFAHRADVRNPDEVAAMAEAARKRFGKIDVLVNNATSPIPNSTFDDLEWNDIEEQMNMHLKAVFNACKAVLPDMVENKRGKIINITTIAADNVPPAKMHAYVIAKSALQALTKTLAVEYGNKGITVNSVAPGMTETSLIADFPDKAKMVTSMQTPLRRLAQPQDVAAAVAFLAGDDASYITGETVRVCGGQIML